MKLILGVLIYVQYCPILAASMLDISYPSPVTHTKKVFFGGRTAPLSFFDVRTVYMNK